MWNRDSLELWVTLLATEDHFANMNSALQLMLLSPADDGLASGGSLLFPVSPEIYHAILQFREMTSAKYS